MKLKERSSDDFLLSINHLSTEYILDHPKFQQVRRHYVSTTLRVYEAGIFPAGLPADGGHASLIGLILCLNAAEDEARPETWASLKQLKIEASRFGLLSPRGIDDICARLVQTGYLNLQRAPADKRIRLLRPTERLTEWDMDWLNAYYSPLDMLAPDPGYGPILNRDPRARHALRRAAMKVLPVSARLMSSDVHLLHFLARRNAIPILMAVADLGVEDPDGSIHVPESLLTGPALSRLGQRLGVSRSHVRKILDAAEERAFLFWSTVGESQLVMTALGRATVDRFIADTLSSSDLTYKIAMKYENETKQGCDRR